MAQATAPAQAQRLADEEIWLRHLLFETELTRSGELHPKFFENYFKPARRGTTSWVLGISGRIYSLTGGNVREFAERVIRQKKLSEAKFRGVAAQRVGQLRQIEEGLYDVSLAEPKKSNPDPAHANLTRSRDWTRIAGEIAYEEILAIRNALKVLPDGNPELENLLTRGQLDAG